jgi:hypothetical protein
LPHGLFAFLDALLPLFLGIRRVLLFYLSSYVLAIVIGALFVLKAMTMLFISCWEIFTDVLTRANERVAVSGSDGTAAVCAQ